MLSSEYLSLLAELETVYPVQTWVVDGLRVWPLIRIHAYLPSCSPSSIGNGRLRRIGSLLLRESQSALANVAVRFIDRHANQHLNRPVDALFLSDGISFLRRSDGWFERFCDPLRERLAAAGYTHAMASLGQARWPRVHPSCYLLTTLRWSVLRYPRVHIDPSKLSGFSHVSARLAAVTGWRTDHSWLAMHVRRVRAYARLYGSILDRVQPKAVFMVSYYNDEGFGLCVACRERGLTSIDLQHGVQGDLHPAYGGWRDVPGDGYGMLPERFWVWGNDESEAISAWSRSCFPHHQAVVAGNTMLDQVLVGSEPSVEAARKVLCRVAPGKRRLLITLQPGFDTSSYYDLLCKVIAGLPPDFGAWLRVHPKMSADQLAIAGRFSSVGGRIEMTEASRSPLYATLAESDVHLTHSSSTVLEAEQFGIGSVLISNYGAELFPRQLSEGRAILALEPKAIVRAISALIHSGSSRELTRQASSRLSALDRHLHGILGAD